MKNDVIPCYAVYKCVSKTNSKRVGYIHWSDDGNSTICGKLLNETWYISDNTFTGRATCPKCKKINNKTDYVSRIIKR